MKVKLENRYLEIFACHSDSTKGRMHNDSKLYFNRTIFNKTFIK